MYNPNQPVVLRGHLCEPLSSAIIVPKAPEAPIPPVEVDTETVVSPLNIDANRAVIRGLAASACVRGSESETLAMLSELGIDVDPLIFQSEVRAFDPYRG